MVIKEVTLQDVALLRDISITTFKQTFEYHNTEADMQKYFADNLSEQQLSLELNDPSSEFYFVYYKETIAGYLKLNFPVPETSETHPGMLEIERIYILQDFQRLSIGTFLLNFAKQMVFSRHLKGIWLGVWEHNVKALSFYKKHGFVQTGSHVFMLGDDEQTDHIMELKLN